MNDLYGAWQARVQRGVMVLLTTLVLSGTAMAAPSRTVLVLGDSLSAAYGLAANQGWVALTAQKMRVTHPTWRVVNASISGETTAGGAARIAAELKRSRPSVVVVELGANDGLRGLSLQQTRTNLDQIIGASTRSGARVLLVGMRMPPNYGADYTEKFQGTYAAVAKAKRVALAPFLLEGFAQRSEYFQTDQLHPAAIAQPLMLDIVWKALAPALKITK